jgi:NodT family efflux transporter outer membrane factor (OMF) lipoprotein
MTLFMGCAAVGPDYIPPNPRAPKKWSTGLSGGLTADPVDKQSLSGWWTTLNDPVLTGLIERAVACNLDLRKAQARLVEERARRGMAESDRYPTLKTSGSATLSRSGGRERKLFEAGFDAAWEIDLFGKIRRSTEAAQAEVEASQESVRDVLVSLLAEVALNYIDVRSYQTRLSIAQKSIKTQEETYQLTLWRSEAGLTSQLDVEQARSNLEETLASVPVLQTGLDQTLNQLALLLGKNPGSLREELSSQAPIPVTPIEIAIGVPADVLRRIPSVRQAERLLAAQTAQIGVATADLYPQFNLVGSIGLESVSIKRLADTSQIFKIGPNFSWPIFDAGRIRKNIKVQNALTEQAMIDYEKAVLTALKDVEDALVAYAKEQVRRQSLQEASESAQRAEDLASSQYSSGLIDFQAVLDSQRYWLSLQTQLAESDASVTANLIRLYKALGGGWRPMTGTDDPATRLDAPAQPDTPTP